ncbi:MAG: DNA polymerase I, partial [Lachnospiraceae bacterium]|nr:DNA polymerase I [Lachnospiraceae bacterium]
MNKKIVLIDGHSILNRAFYGVPELTNAEGLHTNAIYGFLNILFKILEEEKPEYLTVAFDVSAPTFRHDMFEGYKGTRKPMPEELRQQVPVMKEVLRSMGVNIVEKPGFEADDVLGTIAKICERKEMEVSVISGDRDLLQLATEKVKIRIPKTKQGKTETQDYYAADVKEEYQVTPREFIDLKALMGDSSDNISGVPSIGEKTATKIIVAYSSIENAYAHVTELKPPRAGKALEEHYDMAELSKILATIEVNVPLEYNIEQAVIGDLYTEAAYAMFQKLQFKNLLTRFEVSAPTHKVEDYFIEIFEKVKADEVFAKAMKAPVVGVAFSKDTGNTLPLFIHSSGFGGIGIAFSEEDIYIIHSQNDITMEYLFDKLGLVAATVESFSMFDIKEALERIDVTNRKACFDVTIAAYLLNPLKNDYHFDDVAREQLGMMLENTMEPLKKACFESYTAFAAVKPLKERLAETKMNTLYETIEMPLVFTLFDMEQVGIKVQAEALKVYGNELAEKIVAIEKQIYEMAGETFNINSPKQLGVVLFEHLELPYGKKTKTGYSTAADVLEKLAGEFPIVSIILEYRQLTKLKSTYADGLANCISLDGRIHSKFNQTIAATGRISSTEPNLQNIPVRMELGRLIRKVFIPEEGYVFVDADYSQIELRILAHCSGDKQLINAYKEAKDIHRITAS